MFLNVAIEWYLRFLKRAFIAFEKREIECDFKKLVQRLLRLRLSGVIFGSAASPMGPERARAFIVTVENTPCIPQRWSEDWYSDDDDGSSSGWRW